MEGEEGGPPAEPLRRKAATEATINMSKRNATRMKRFKGTGDIPNHPNNTPQHQNHSNSTLTTLHNTKITPQHPNNTSQHQNHTKSPHNTMTISHNTFQHPNHPTTPQQHPTTPTSPHKTNISAGITTCQLLSPP
ncbi:hypothetical protein E2C01_004482 [Portunus trituberculatus]|uniref:Uncharacterized protein n=1 Tax=Portunus trituberculatus TaxID=210409 RepID=A0A5B7CPW6_PORTR|nr:hypothetical protein [Portunus trituberculatus]